MTEYTPGYSDVSVAFMARRSFDSHARFVAPFVKPGMRVLDCGCGPGTITIELARHVHPGNVTGVDLDESQVELAGRRAREHDAANITFCAADASQLPFGDDEFDIVFSHAMLEHVSRPIDIIGEFARVLRRGGVLATCCSDWSGFLFAPRSAELTAAFQTYQGLQTANGGDVNIGGSLGELCRRCGFHEIRLDARYEVHASRERIGEYLATQLKASESPDHAETLRGWSRRDDGLFAQSWVACIAVKP